MGDRAAQTGRSEFRKLVRQTPPQIRNFRELKGIQSVWKASSKKCLEKEPIITACKEGVLGQIMNFFLLSCERWEAIEHRGLGIRSCA